MMNSPGSKERTLVGLFSGLAVGGIAFLAAGGVMDGFGFAVASLALLAVGPVVWSSIERLLFRLGIGWYSAASAPQAAAEVLLHSPSEVGGVSASSMLLESLSTTPRKGLATDERKEKGAEGDEGKARSPPKVERRRDLHRRGAEKEADADTAVAGNAAAAVQKAREASAFEVLAELWRSLPPASSFLQGAACGFRALPSQCARFPGALRELWEWLAAPCWRPFPWVYLPDPAAFLWGVLTTVFIAPIASIEILVTVPTMALLKAELQQERSGWLRSTIPELVRSISRPLGCRMLRDPRNHSYLPWMALLGFVVPALFFWAMRRHALHGLEFSTLCIYHLIRVGPRFQFFAHAHTLAHKEGHSHKGFFKGIFQVLNSACEWWIGPFYGVVPWNYYIAHMKIHHRWHNDVDDVHTNLDLDRTNPLSFFLYVPRFSLYWSGLSPLCLLVKRGEWVLSLKLLYGMVAYYGLTLALLHWNPIFCTVYWVFPHMEASQLLCAISYLWHAFVEEKDPGNQYVNSVTILEGHDNVWNEDYHVVHHHAPNTHWTDAPDHFEAHRAQYAAVTATIFRDTEQGKLLQWLFEQNWEMMAKHFEDLNGKLSHEEKKSLIVRRLSYTVGEQGRNGKRVEWGSTSTIRHFTE